MLGALAHCKLWNYCVLCVCHQSGDFRIDALPTESVGTLRTFSVFQPRLAWRVHTAAQRRSAFSKFILFNCEWKNNCLFKERTNTLRICLLFGAFVVWLCLLIAPDARQSPRKYSLYLLYSFCGWNSFHFNRFYARERTGCARNYYVVVIRCRHRWLICCKMYERETMGNRLGKWHSARLGADS